MPKNQRRRAPTQTPEAEKPDERITLRVTPNGDRWKLTLTPGGLVLLDRAKTQRRAKRLARTIAKVIADEERPAQVVVHEADGTISYELTFPRSSDPPESPG